MGRRPCISSFLRITGLVAVLSACLCASVAAAARPATDPASALRARYAALREQLDHSPFPQHLHVESMEGPGASQGDVYAVVDYPIATVSDAFSNPANWCDALILHLNVKYCRPLARDGRMVLSTAIGRNFDQPLSSTYRVNFVYSITASRPDYVDVDLHALHGPLGTGITVSPSRLWAWRRSEHSYTSGIPTPMASRVARR